MVWLSVFHHNFYDDCRTADCKCWRPWPALLSCTTVRVSGARLWPLRLRSRRPFCRLLAWCKFTAGLWAFVWTVVIDCVPWDCDSCGSFSRLQFPTKKSPIKRQVMLIFRFALILIDHSLTRFYTDFTLEEYYLVYRKSRYRYI